MDNPYTTLGVDKNSTDEEIKRAYRKIAVKYHPDKNSSKEAEDLFRKATEAYDILKDPQKRRTYDTYGSTEKPSGFGGFGGFSGAKTRFYQDINININDIFGSDPFGFNTHETLKQWQQQQARKKDGETLQARISVTLEEVALGCSKTIKYKRKVKCPSCKGSGAKNEHGSICGNCGGSGKHFGRLCLKCGGIGKTIHSPCSVCQGERLVSKKEEVSFRVPKGVTDENHLTIKGQGNESPDGGVDGDFLVFVTVVKHDVYTRIKDDLAITVFVDEIEAILGTKVTINTLYGTKIRVTVNPGTQPNHKMKIKGQGLPNRYSGVNGDLQIFIKVEIPKKLTMEEKALYQQIKNLRSKNTGDSHERTNS